MTALGENLRQWHDFFSLSGAAAATLVGLMFVAASLGAGVFTNEHQIGIRSFLSPTVVHFSAVLLLPDRERTWYLALYMDLCNRRRSGRAGLRLPDLAPDAEARHHPYDRLD